MAENSDLNPSDNKSATDEFDENKIPEEKEDIQDEKIEVPNTNVKNITWSTTKLNDNESVNNTDDEIQDEINQNDNLQFENDNDISGGQSEENLDDREEFELNLPVETDYEDEKRSYTSVQIDPLQDKRRSARYSTGASPNPSMSLSDEKFFISSPKYSLSAPELPEKPSVGLESIPEEKSEEKEDVVSEESETDQVDRNLYYEMYILTKQQLKREKSINKILQAKMATYYMQRKMYYILKEDPATLNESTNRYQKTLNLLDEINETCKREKEMMLLETDRLKNKAASVDTGIKATFEKLQEMVQNYGYGLENKIGANNIQKVTDRFVHRQKNQMKALTTLRLSYILVRNKFNEKTREMEELDHLGSGYRIMDYVQLKYDNRALQDKLDEKEGELIKYRRSCQNASQILAHVREKNQVLDLDLKKLLEHHGNLESEVYDAREQMNYLAKERDLLRNRIKNLKAKSGLLTYPKLLRHMERSIAELEKLRLQAAELKPKPRLKTKDDEIINFIRNYQNRDESR